MSQTTRAVPRWRRPLIWIVVALVVVTAAVVAWDAAFGDEISSEPAEGVAVGEVDGRTLAVVVYKNDTFPRLDLRRIESMGFSTQAEAFDLDTGERVWDTMLFAEFGGTDAQVLGWESGNVFIRSARGLLILDAATGRITAREDSVDGLGEDAVAAFDAYAWDEETRSVVMLDANGRILRIPPGSTSAVPAAAEIEERWRPELFVNSEPVYAFSPGDWDHTSHLAPVRAESTAGAHDGVAVEPTWAADGWDVEVLLDPGTELSIGAEYGFAVTQTYQPDTSDASHLIQVGELETQRLIGTVEVATDAWSLVDSGRGHIAMLSANDAGQGVLIVVTAEDVRASIIGERGLWGW